MPPKSAKARRAKAADSSREFAHTECQTDFYDEEFEKSMHAVASLKQQQSIVAGGEGSSSTSMASGRNPNVLLMQLKTSAHIIAKISSDAQKTRKENERIVSFFAEVFRLVRAMRSEYDSTFLNVRDNMKAMSSDMGRYVGEVQEFLSKQKSLAEEDRKRYKSSIKGKDVQIEHLQEKLKTSNDNLATVMQALEAQQRRITVAERDVHTSREEVREVNRKLNDQLYLAGNQKCISCQANERVREMLSNEVAEKTNTANTFHQRCCEMENQLMQQKHVNEILSRSVDKHAFSEKAYRGEFERIKAEYDALIVETRTLRSQAKIDAANVASVITPPDSSASDKSSKEDSAGADTGSIHPTPNGTTSSPSCNANASGTNQLRTGSGGFGSSGFASSTAAASSSAATGSMERPYSAASSTTTTSANNPNKHHDFALGKGRPIRGRELLLPMPPGHKPAKPAKPQNHNYLQQQKQHHFNNKFEHHLTANKQPHNTGSQQQQQHNNRQMSSTNFGKRLSSSSLQESAYASKKKISSPAITSTSTSGGDAPEKDGEPSASSSTNLSANAHFDSVDGDDDGGDRPPRLKTPPLVALFAKRNEEAKIAVEKKKASAAPQSGDMREATTLLLPFEKARASSNNAAENLAKQETLMRTSENAASKKAEDAKRSRERSRSTIGGTRRPYSVASTTAAEATTEEGGQNAVIEGNRPYAAKILDNSTTTTNDNASLTAATIVRRAGVSVSQEVIRTKRDRKLASRVLKRAKRTKLNNSAASSTGSGSTKPESVPVRGFCSPPTAIAVDEMTKAPQGSDVEKGTSTSSSFEAGDKAQFANKAKIEKETSRKVSTTTARPASTSSATSVERKRARQTFVSPKRPNRRNPRKAAVYSNAPRAPQPTSLFGRPFNQTAAFSQQQQQRVVDAQRIVEAHRVAAMQQAAVVREQTLLREQQLIRDRQIMLEQQQALANEQRQQQQLRRNQQQQAHQIQLLREQQRHGLMQSQSMMNQQRPQQWLFNRPMNSGDLLASALNMPRPSIAQQHFQQQSGGMADPFGRQQQLPPRPPSGMPRPPESPLLFRQGGGGGLPWHGGGGGGGGPPQFQQQQQGPSSSSWAPRMYSRRS